MQLPSDVLTIIKEYSMPQTKANWKTLQKMSKSKFIYELNMWYFLFMYKNKKLNMALVTLINNMDFRFHIERFSNRFI